MHGAGLIFEIVSVCLFLGSLIGRIAERKRLTGRGPEDWNRMFLLMFTAGFINCIGEAGKAGWIPYPSFAPTLVGWGMFVFMVPSIYLIAKMYREVTKNRITR